LTWYTYNYSKLVIKKINTFFFICLSIIPYFLDYNLLNINVVNNCYSLNAYNISPVQTFCFCNAICLTWSIIRWDFISCHLISRDTYATTAVFVIVHRARQLILFFVFFAYHRQKWLSFAIVNPSVIVAHTDTQPL